MSIIYTDTADNSQMLAAIYGFLSSVKGERD